VVQAAANSFDIQAINIDKGMILTDKNAWTGGVDFIDK
jgi:hypothetical protein